MLTVKVITPEGSMYESSDVVAVTVATVDGIIVIYEGHEAIMSLLQPGELSIEKADHTSEMVISSGVVQVKDGKFVNLLVETAERVEEVDVSRAEDAKRRAEEFLASQTEVETEDFIRLQAKIQKELARIDLASQYRKRRGQSVAN